MAGWKSRLNSDERQLVEVRLPHRIRGRRPQNLFAFGYAQGLRLANALALVEAKQVSDGCWKLEYTINGKMLADIERRASRASGSLCVP